MVVAVPLGKAAVALIWQVALVAVVQVRLNRHVESVRAAELAGVVSKLAGVLNEDGEIRVAAVALELEARVSGSRGCGGLESQGHGGEELGCQHVCEGPSGIGSRWRGWYISLSRPGCNTKREVLEMLLGPVPSRRQRVPFYRRGNARITPPSVMQSPIPVRVELQPGVTPDRVLPSAAAQSAPNTMA